MAVLTESEIRNRLKRADLNEVKEFVIEKGQIITPSAKSYLAEKNIVLKYKDEEENNNSSKYREQKRVEFKEIKSEEPKEKKYKYVTVFGTKLDYKPEHMTHLKGNLLVFKDHKRIVFRGRMDTLESKILESQILCQKNGIPKLVDELQEMLIFVRNMIRAEVLDEDLNDFTLLGLKEDELRAQSHNPKKYFGIGHEFPDYRMGEVVVSINSLRALTREVELAAFEAFKGEYGSVTREDIIRGLNRLSSAFWIMIFKVRTNKYK
ncbi:ethanolamine corrinoid cobalamin adenosyltransferase [Clostridium sardiniense]|uniref:cobalamin adenosyltransferase n=1 Tax=Clostridium sardiniense TaxID=29369 RepID=UPI003C33CAD3